MYKTLLVSPKWVWDYIYVDSELTNQIYLSGTYHI